MLGDPSNTMAGPAASLVARAGPPAIEISPATASSKAANVIKGRRGALPHETANAGPRPKLPMLSPIMNAPGIYCLDIPARRDRLT